MCYSKFYNRLLHVILGLCIILPLHAQQDPEQYRQELNQWHEAHSDYYKQLDSLENTKKKSSVPLAVTHTKMTHHCQDVWLSGSNVAWASYGRDVGIGYAPDLNYFNTMFDKVKAAGGNSMRWWLHTNASFTPHIESSGNCTGLAEGTNGTSTIISQVKSVLDAAYEKGIVIDVCLFSFDLLQDQWSMDPTANKNFLTSETNIQSYIDNALIPMVDSLKGHPALLCWEIFNEPEGMTNEFGWTSQKVDMADIQKFVNLVAGAIHRTDPNTPVTNGSWAFRALSDVLTGTNEQNYYRDDRLIAAGGDADGTLDFYQVHYYSWAGTALSPFHHDKSYWGLDKELMVAEFHSEETFGVETDQLYHELYDRGYFGAWGWHYNEEPLWDSIEVSMKEFDMDNGSETTLDLTLPCSSTNQPATIAIASPSGGEQVETGQEIDVEIDASGGNNTITKVTLFVNDIAVNDDTESPYLIRFTPTSEGEYQLKAVLTDSEGITKSSSIVTISAYDCPIIQVEGDTICSAGDVMLKIIGGTNTYNWYTVETDGTSVFEGASYETSITSSTTFYVEEITSNTQDYTLGKLTEDAGITVWGINDFDVNDKKIKITVTNKVQIDAVSVYPSNNGTNVTLRIMQGTEEVGFQTVNSLNTGIQRIPLGIILEPGEYTIDAVGTSDKLRYATEGASFPYTLNDMMSFTGTESWVLSNNRYGLFYNWEISQTSTLNCVRTPVVAIIDPSHEKCIDLKDCHGDINGTASIDDCGVCSGGNTGKVANSSCVQDCNGDWNGTASIDDCGVCSGGNTGKVANSSCVQDCNGDWNGTAFIDDCGVCSGGNTGKVANSSCVQDCNGDWNGTASIDDCGVCSGGNTGKVANSSCVQDCHGDWNGTAYLDDCNECVAGNTNKTPCGNDCAGVPGGSASLDNCGVCAGGTTGKAMNENCEMDCHGDWGGTASIDDCGICSGGNTGKDVNSSCIQDCNGDWNGSAYLDDCNECVAGNTTKTPCEDDCAGEPGGTASVDNCNVCSGGTTGITVDDCVTSTEDVSSEHLTLYPNPTQGNVYLSYTSKWYLYDMFGQLLLIGDGQSINLENYSTGLYLLKVEGQVFRVIKE